MEDWNAGEISGGTLHRIYWGFLELLLEDTVDEFLKYFLGVIVDEFLKEPIWKWLQKYREKLA